MKSAVETLSPTRAKLTVEVPFEELKPSLDAAYQKIAKQINVPGFRKGKVPPPVIDRQVGRGAVLDEAINDALPQLYVQALQEQRPPAAGPAGDRRDQVRGQRDPRVHRRGRRQPEITCPAYDGLEVEVEDIAVTDDDIDEQVEALRSGSPPSTTSSARPQTATSSTIDLKATQDGEAVEGAEVTGFSYKVGCGDMLDGIDEALRGLSAGEDATFTSQLLGGDLSGQDVEVAVSLDRGQGAGAPRARRRVRPDRLGVRHRRRADCRRRERLERGKRLEQAAAARDAVLEQLLEPRIPLPEVWCRGACARRRNRAAARLRRHHHGAVPRGRGPDTSRSSRPSWSAGSATRSPPVPARRDGEEQEIGVDQESSQHMVRRAQQSGQDPEEFANHMFEHNHMPEMVRRSCAARRSPRRRGRDRQTPPATRSS